MSNDTDKKRFGLRLPVGYIFRLLETLRPYFPGLRIDIAIDNDPSKMRNLRANVFLTFSQNDGTFEIVRDMIRPDILSRMDGLPDVGIIENNEIDEK